MTETRPIPVRLEDEAIARLDAMVDEMRRRTAGARISRSEVLRMVVDRGIPVLERELGASKKRKKRG
ncbi:MAG: hypothetical protein ACODAG_11785 [Myxococcota bacterium]